MDKKVAEFIKEQMKPENIAKRMKEGKPSIADQIPNAIDLLKKPPK